MSPASPRMRHLAKRLAVCERNANSTSETTNASAFHVPEPIQPQAQGTAARLVSFWGR